MTPEEPSLPAGYRGLAPLIAKRLAPDAHGDMARWRQALGSLPDLTVQRFDPSDTIELDGPADAVRRRQLESALRRLHPWRKGPFRLFGVQIDSEWRSDWKWRRVAPHLSSLQGHRVLDVGCGNGYFGWRMLAAGAAEVLGVDPTLIYCMQHRAINHYVRSSVNHVLPLRFEELPDMAFDSVFSMGVIYHRRDPAEHAGRLFRHTAPGGQVVVESLIVDAADPLRPAGRYARMRNVHVVPTVELLQSWLESAGFVDLRLVDASPTTTAEQRSTDWMHFQSLAQSLDPGNPQRTLEGHPAPLRAVLTGRKPV